jgi:hypothetical protein
MQLNLTIDGFRLLIGFMDSYRSVTTSNCNRFTNSHTLQFTRAHTEVFSVLTNCCLVMASSGGRSSSSKFLNCPQHQLPASNSNSWQWLNCSCHLTLHWLTDSSQLNSTNCPAYNITAWTTQKTLFLCCSSVVAVETCLFAKLLLSNSCCMFAYLMVIAQQRVYMPQYEVQFVGQPLQT